ncbi:hypothetical protein ACU4GD_44800 [Cupriavidus basilensis]
MTGIGGAAEGMTVTHCKTFAPASSPPLRFGNDNWQAQGTGANTRTCAASTSAATIQAPAPAARGRRLGYRVRQWHRWKPVACPSRRASALERALLMSQAMEIRSDSR